MEPFVIKLHTKGDDFWRDTATAPLCATSHAVTSAANALLQSDIVGSQPYHMRIDGKHSLNMQILSRSPVHPRSWGARSSAAVYSHAAPRV